MPRQRAACTTRARRTAHCLAAKHRNVCLRAALTTPSPLPRWRACLSAAGAHASHRGMVARRANARHAARTPPPRRVARRQRTPALRTAHTSCGNASAAAAA